MKAIDNLILSSGVARLKNTQVQTLVHTVEVGTSKENDPYERDLCVVNIGGRHFHTYLGMGVVIIGDELFDFVFKRRESIPTDVNMLRKSCREFNCTPIMLSDVAKRKDGDAPTAAAPTLVEGIQRARQNLAASERELAQSEVRAQHADRALADAMARLR